MVDERRQRNDEYHYVYRGNKEGFWESVARRIRRRFSSRYSPVRTERTIPAKGAVRDRPQVLPIRGVRDDNRGQTRDTAADRTVPARDRGL